MVSAQLVYFQDTSLVFIKLAVPFELEMSFKGSCLVPYESLVVDFLFVKRVVLPDPIPPMQGYTPVKTGVDTLPKQRNITLEHPDNSG
jgi:hypothetical protein